MKHFKKSIVVILAMTASLSVLASESIPANDAPTCAIATIGLSCYTSFSGGNFTALNGVWQFERLLSVKSTPAG